MKLYDLCLQGLVPRKRLWWRINITGYGPYEFYGTKEEATYSKDAKAEWEGGIGSMRKAKPAEIKDGIAMLEWKKNRGYGMETRELEALANG